MFRELRASLTLFLLLMLMTGFAYPFLVLNIGQAILPYQSNGSLIEENGKLIGSSLIGQNFSGDAYFHPRPSAAGSGYDAAHSSGSNLAPTSADLMKAVGDRAAALKLGNASLSVPIDLVTTSGSGLDPDLSPAAARFQAARVADARHTDVVKIQELIGAHIRPRDLGFLGDNRVNVLELNRALDQITPAPPSSP